MTVASVVVGAVTDSGVRFAAQATAPAVFEVSPEPGFLTPLGQAVAPLMAFSGLDPDTRYWWQTEGYAGSFRTDPTVGEPASFIVGAGGDGGLTPAFPGVTGAATHRLSNHPVYDLLADRAVAEDWRRIIHLGDLHYYNLGSGAWGLGSDAAAYRQAYSDVLAQPRQARLYRSCPLVYTWDDHDFGPDNSGAWSPTRSVALQVYRERVPSYPLPGVGIEHSFVIGRVLFVVSDCRSYAALNADTDSPAKTMLGPAQLAWMDNVLATTAAQALVWVQPRQWLGTQPGGDGWNSFTHERAQLVQMLGDRGFLDRTVMLSADAHYLGVATGAKNPHGGFPVFQFASFDGTPTESAMGRFDTPSLGGRGQYGTVQVHDLGDQIVITGTCWAMRHPVQWYSHLIGGL